MMQDLEDLGNAWSLWQRWEDEYEKMRQIHLPNLKPDGIRATAAAFGIELSSQPLLVKTWGMWQTLQASVCQLSCKRLQKIL